MSTITQGDRVFHPNKKEWGLGKVLNVTSENVDVFFVGAGAKRLSRSFIGLECVEGVAAKHALLDNLIETAQIDNAAFVTLSAAIARFDAIYPDGLDDKRYVKEERETTLRGHQFCVQLLSESELSAMISEGRYQDICDRARHAESLTGLLTKSEKAALYSALDNPLNQRTFAQALAELYYGAGSEEERFKQFIRALDLLGIAKWPIVTLFAFLRFPGERVFVKPTVIQGAAKALCWRIAYQTEPNWRTYCAVARLFKHVRNSLLEEGIMPRDNIDVQAVIGTIIQK